MDTLQEFRLALLRLVFPKVRENQLNDYMRTFSDLDMIAFALYEAGFDVWIIGRTYENGTASGGHVEIRDGTGDDPPELPRSMWQFDTPQEEGA